jgi:RNA polymerase sigma-70 factor, ECF subfamily
MAAALGEAHGPDIGLTVLNSLSDGDIVDYQPYWAVRGHLLARAGRAPEARVAYNRAIHLSEEVAVRSFLLAQAALVS